MIFSDFYVNSPARGKERAPAKKIKVFIGTKQKRDDAALWMLDDDSETGEAILIYPAINLLTN